MLLPGIEGDRDACGRHAPSIGLAGCSGKRLKASALGHRKAAARRRQCLAESYPSRHCQGGRVGFKRARMDASRLGMPPDVAWQWLENNNDKSINIEIFLNIAYLDPA